MYYVKDIKNEVYRNFLRTKEYNEIKKIFNNTYNLVQNFEFIGKLYFKKDDPFALMLNENDTQKIFNILNINFNASNLKKENVSYDIKTIDRNKLKQFYQNANTKRIENPNYYKSIRDKKKKKEKKREQKKNDIRQQEKLKKSLKDDNKFIAIDIEFSIKKGEGTCPVEIGYSFYDKSRDITINEHFIISDYKDELKYCYIPYKHQKMYSYGVSQTVTLEECVNKLRRIVSNTDCVIFHGGNSDKEILEKIGVELNKKRQLDSQKICRQLLNLNNRPSLFSMIEFFNLPEVPLHNAGNDACMTLAVFARAIRDSTFCPQLNIVKDYSESKYFISEKEFKQNKRSIKHQELYIKETENINRVSRKIKL